MNKTSGMRLMLGLVLGAALTLAAGTAVALLLALRATPASPFLEPLAAAEARRTEELILDLAPPATGVANPFPVSLDEGQVNGLLRYGIGILSLTDDWAAHVALSEGRLQVWLSRRLFHRLPARYLNIHASFESADGRLALRALRVGGLRLPERSLPAVASALRRQLAAREPVFGELERLVGEVATVRLPGERIDLGLRWNPAQVARFFRLGTQLSLTRADRLRALDYYRRSGEVATAAAPTTRALSLAGHLAPLFAMARDASLAGGNPIAENRALLLALATYVGEDSIAAVVGAEFGRGIPSAPWLEVRLSRRQDLAVHLTYSASLAAAVGGELALLLSVAKESYDARYRSGFSFSDITANAVGVKIAELATRDRSSALAIQRRFAAVRDEAEFMPPVGGQRDGLSEATFAARFASRTSPQYQARLAEINALIDARPVFRDLAAE